MKYGYARCSTNESKQDVARQVRQLLAQGVEKENLYTEYESGGKDDRIELNRVLSLIQPGDELLAVDVTRLTRSVKQLCEIIEFFKEKRAILSCGSLRIDCTQDTFDSFTEGVVKIIGVVGEMQRLMTQQAVKSGLSNAVANGQVLGRRPTTLEAIPPLFMKYYEKYQSKEINVTELAKLSGISRKTAYKYMRIIREAEE